MIEELLSKPYCVVNLLPEQVPANSGGQFFAIEKYILEKPRRSALYERFADILLMINCFYDFLCAPAGSDEFVKNPPPTQLVLTVTEGETGVCILIPDEAALITFYPGDTHMTVYNPGKKLLKLIKQSASASGLFVWKPERQTTDA